MAKISRLGGFTDATVRELLPAVAEVAAPVEKDTPKEAESWRGSSSETSPVKPPKTDAPRKPNPPKRAPTTGNRSSNTGGSGTARSTATSGPATDD